MWTGERLELPHGREVVLGWAAVGPEDDARLMPLEREGLARCRTAKRRREFVAGRLAAHEALERLVPGLRAQVTARTGGPDAGRPVLVPGQELALSITHSTGLAVAALARGPGALGVDLEARVDAGEAFLEEAFAPGEHARYLALHAPLHATTAAWALKEAVLKVWGVGLRAPLQKVALRPELLQASPGRLVLRVGLDTQGLPPGLGEPPSVLGALLLLEDGATGRVLAVAG